MSKTFRIALFIVVPVSATLGIIFTRIPLLNVIGYETGGALAVFIAVCGSALGIIAGRETRTHEAADSPTAVYLINTKYFACLVTGMLALLLPFTIVAVNTFFVKKCNLGPGIPLFFFITIPTLAHYTAVGLFLGRSRSTWWRAALLTAGYFLLTTSATLIEALNGPHFTFHNLTLGMFSMTGFNGYQFILPTSFYIFRALVTFLSIFFIGLAILINPEGREINPTDRFTGRRNVAAAVFVFLFCLLSAPDITGLGSGQRTLDKELNQRLETENAVLHFSKETFRNNEAALAGKYIEWYLFEIRDAMKMEQPWKVHVYLYNDSAQMERHTYSQGVYFAQPWKQSLHIEKWSYDRSVMKHELVHVMMGEYGTGLFKVPINMGLVEGIAMAVENNYFRGREFQEQFAASLQAGVISSADKSISNTGFGASSMFKSYNMAGGFIGFLIHEYGPDKFKEYYANNNAPATYGKDLKLLNSEWTVWLEGVKVSAYELRKAAYYYDDKAFPAFFKTDCPRVGDREEPDDPDSRYKKLVENNSDTEAASLCEDIYLENGDPQWLVNKGRRLINMHEYEKALDAADRALAARKIPPETKDKAYDLKALSLSRLKRYDEAAATLEEKKEFGFEDPEKVELLIRVARRESVRDLLLSSYIWRGELYGIIIDKALEADPGFGLLYLFKARSIWAERENLEMSLGAKRELIVNFIKNTEGLNKTKFETLSEMGEEYLKAGMSGDAQDAYVKMSQFAHSEEDNFQVRRALERTRYFESLQKSQQSEFADN